MKDVLLHYGFPTGRNGRIPCPLHNGHDPNFSYKDRYFKCFVCGKGGDVIRFVMELFGITFPQAMVRLSSDFGLGLYADSPRPAARSKIIEQRRREKREREELLGRQRELSSKICYWNEIRRYFAPSREDMEMRYVHPLYLDALKRLPHLEYEWDELENRLEGGKAFE